MAILLYLAGICIVLFGTRHTMPDEIAWIWYLIAGFGLAITGVLVGHKANWSTPE